MVKGIEEFAALLKGASAPVFFGGAGVSTESGIPDFRSQDGLYSQKYAFAPEQILSHSFFLENTGEFYRFYRDKMIITSANPNPAHTFLAQSGIPVVTQNIDGLHSLAVSPSPNYLTPLEDSIFELHGSIHRNYCMKCRAFYTLEELGERIDAAPDLVPRCTKAIPPSAALWPQSLAQECGGVLKPDVVLYEEGLDDVVWNGAMRAIQNCDILIVGGTSLTVYPAASLVRSFRGTHLVLLNHDPTDADANADLIIREPIGKVFEEVARKL